MSCEKNCQDQNNLNNNCKGSGYIILIVLYILLAIILGSYIW